MQNLSRQNARTLARALAYARIALGVTAYVAPGIPARPWVGGDAARQPPVRLLARALGARDLALGLGAVLAVQHDTVLRGWVEAAGVADAGDLLATAASWRACHRLGRWAVVASTAGAIVAARLLAPAVDLSEVP